MDTSKYKELMTAGDRAGMVAEAIRLVTEAGGTPEDPRPTNVSANFGADNSKETATVLAAFKQNAIGISATLDAYASKAVRGLSTLGEVKTMVGQLKDLQSAQNNILEIERIERGDKVGTGHDFLVKPEGGSIEDRLIRIESKIDAIFAAVDNN